MNINNLRRILIVINVMVYIALVILGALTNKIYISLISLGCAALWAVNLYAFDKYEKEKDY